MNKKFNFRSYFLAALAMLGLNTACGQGNFENAEVSEFAELVADSNVVPPGNSGPRVIS